MRELDMSELEMVSAGCSWALFGDLAVAVGGTIASTLVQSFLKSLGF